MASVGMSVGRGVRVMGLIGTAHFMSHFYFLALPPLFTVLSAELHLSYTALGFLLTVLNLTSTLATTPVGFIVDRFGARRVLVGGLLVQAVATGAIGLVDSYLAWVGLFGIAGIAYAVYHPADYAIMSAAVPDPWRGRAFSVHACSGNLGSAAVPLTMVWLSHVWGWHAAFVAIGLVGVALAILIALQGDTLVDETETTRRAAKANPVPSPKPAVNLRQEFAMLFTAPVMMCFLYYVVSQMSLGGLRSFAAAALVDMNHASLAAANAALTGLMLAAATGILVGGWVADRFGPRVLTAVIGLVASAGLLFVIGSVSLPIVAITVLLSLSGFLRGTIQSTRDLIVLSVTPKGATGKVFAFVYNGATIGGMIVPLVFGWVLDSGTPSAVFWVSGCAMLAALLTFIGIKRAIASGRGDVEPAADAA